jgi:hypothetical protein
LPAFLALTPDFQADYLDLKAMFRGDLLLQLLKRGAGVFNDCSATEAGKMKMSADRLGFKIVLLALQVHKVELVNQPKLFEKLKSAIHRGSVNMGISLTGPLEQRGSVQMDIGFLQAGDYSASLAGKPHTLRGDLFV